MKMLVERVGGHDNNFDFIRWLAATMVVVSHEFAVIPGVEPLLVPSHGFAVFGTLGVDMFFVVSGFLVTRSLVERAALDFFVVARFLRIVPGLLVMLVLTTFVMGPLVSSLPVVEYFARRDPYAYFTHNLMLYTPQWTLSSVFTHNPGMDAVNGSLWSLWPEVQMYGVLFSLGVLALAWPRARAMMVGAGMLVATLAGFLQHGDLAGHALEPSTLARLAPYFGFGALLYLGRRWVPLTLFGPAIVGISAVAARHTICFVPLFTLALAMSVIWFAHVRIPFIARWGRFGDVSYGLYIYAFPLQQALLALDPGLNRLTHFMMVYPLILLCAWLSWHGVESPALMLKRRWSVFRGRTPAGSPAG